MLCALGAAVFAAAAASRLRGLAAAALGRAAGAAWAAPARLPDAAAIGALTALVAAGYLFRPRVRLFCAAFGGLLAGLATALLEVQGLPVVLSPIAALLLVAIPAWLARTRPGFAPEVLRDESMLAIGLLGLAVAVLPGILDGWQAAATLAAASERTVGAAVPLWTLVLLVTSSSLGALYSVWSRR